MTPKSSAYLGASCVAFIAAIGSIFELSSGEAQLGFAPTVVVLSLSVPLGVFLFIAAVRDAKAGEG